MAKFVVVADAVTVTVGERVKGKRGTPYRRVLKGQLIEGDPNKSEQLSALLHKQAIVQVKSKDEAAQAAERPHRTARQTSQVQGAPDDPVEAPQTAVEPLPAPVPETNPEALTAEDLEPEGAEA